MCVLKSSGSHNSDLIVGLVDLASHLHKLGTDGLKVLGDDVLDRYITHGCCCSHHEGSGLYLIGNDGILSSVELLNSLDADDIGTCALDVSSHAVEEVRNINDVWLLGCVLDDGLALSHYSRHHDIDGSTYADNIEVDVASHELISLGIDDILNVDLGSKSSKALDMLVDRTKADVTATGKCNSGILILTKESTKEVVTCPDLLDIIIFNCMVFDLRSIDLHRMSACALDKCAYALDSLKHGIGVGGVRHIIYIDSLVRHGCCCKDCQCSVLGSADLDLANQWISAFYHVFFHRYLSSFS